MHSLFFKAVKFYFYKGIILLRYFLGVGFCIIFSGCSYIIEGSNPVLPDGAKTLALPPIQNKTFKAGLETDLAEQIKILLRTNSSVKIVPSGISDLQLKITLIKLDTISAGLNDAQIASGVKAKIEGQVILEDMRTKKTIWKKSLLEVKSDGIEEQESSSVSSFSLSRTIRELIKTFASKVYHDIFTTF